MDTASDTTFGERLNFAVKQRGIVLTELAILIEVAQSSIYHWGSSRHYPNVRVAARLAKRLGVSLDWLTGLTNEEPDWASVDDVDVT